MGIHDLIATHNQNRPDTLLAEGSRAMLETAAAALIAFLGPKATELLGAAVKDQVKKHLGSLLSAAEQKALGKQQVDALRLAYESTLTHAYSRTLDALGRVLELTGISFAEFFNYQESVDRFIHHRAVAEHLLATVRNLSDSSLPDPTLLESEWQRLDGRPFPTPGVWGIVAASFRAAAREKAFVTPNLREVLNAQNLDAIRQLQEKLLGVQVRVRHEQYINRMKKKYAAVERDGLQHLQRAPLSEFTVTSQIPAISPGHRRAARSRCAPCLHAGLDLAGHSAAGLRGACSRSGRRFHRHRRAIHSR